MDSEEVGILTEWEMILLLALGVPFALYYWMISGLGRLAKKSTANKSVS